MIGGRAGVDEADKPVELGRPAGRIVTSGRSFDFVSVSPGRTSGRTGGEPFAVTAGLSFDFASLSVARADGRTGSEPAPVIAGRSFDFATASSVRAIGGTGVEPCPATFTEAGAR